MALTSTSFPRPFPYIPFCLLDFTPSAPLRPSSQQSCHKHYKVLPTAGQAYLCHSGNMRIGYNSTIWALWGPGRVMDGRCGAWCFGARDQHDLGPGQRQQTQLQSPGNRHQTLDASIPGKPGRMMNPGAQGRRWGVRHSERPWASPACFLTYNAGRKSSYHRAVIRTTRDNEHKALSPVSST